MKKKSKKAQGTGKQIPASRPPGSNIPYPQGNKQYQPIKHPSDHGSIMDARKRTDAKGKNKKKRSDVEILITGGILAASSVMVVSLFVYFRPFSGEDVISFARSLYSYAAEQVEGAASFLSSRIHPEPETQPSESFALETEEAEETVPYMAHSSELGDISDMTAEPVFPLQEDAIYACMLDTPMGPLFYYNQGDLRWKEYLYGGSDRMAKYGCGPTCVAMIINSFTFNSVTPVEMADWASANGYHARQSGSYHGLIPGSLSAFGLQVDSVTDRTVEQVSELLGSGHILVALMGKGSLTQNGHFIIIAQLAEDGSVYIADPANYENSTKVWDLQLLMDELKGAYDSGGPLWAVSFPLEGQEADGS